MALAGMLCTLTTRTVQADAGLQRPTAAPSQVVASATPAMSAPAPVKPKQHGKILRGIASWYGTVFNGRKTANGETYNMYDMTACHPTLPFGSLVRVVNLRNKKSVVVRINDHSDLVNGRSIDLSYAAAEQLNMTGRGLARVSLEVISVGPPSAAGPPAS
ncbi:MAG TPA: septal ring lytic transglycosylase RlpA family protein [Terracidiphilus sp.]